MSDSVPLKSIENQQPTSTPKSSVKLRKLWVESRPFTPPSQNSPGNGKSQTLELTYFSKKPCVDFGKVAVGTSKVRELVIANVNQFDADVVVERFPKKNFAILYEKFSIDAGESHILAITWTPENAGGCRELVTVSYNGLRVQALFVGEAVASRAKKKKVCRKKPREPLQERRKPTEQTSNPSAKHVNFAAVQSENENRQAASSASSNHANVEVEQHDKENCHRSGAVFPSTPTRGRRSSRMKSLPQPRRVAALNFGEEKHPPEPVCPTTPVSGRPPFVVELDDRSMLREVQDRNHIHATDRPGKASEDQPDESDPVFPSTPLSGRPTFVVKQEQQKALMRDIRHLSSPVFDDSLTIESTSKRDGRLSRDVTQEAATTSSGDTAGLATFSCAASEELAFPSTPIVGRPTFVVKQELTSPMREQQKSPMHEIRHRHLSSPAFDDSLMIESTSKRDDNASHDVIHGVATTSDAAASNCITSNVATTPAITDCSVDSCISTATYVVEGERNEGKMTMETKPAASGKRKSSSASAGGAQCKATKVEVSGRTAVGGRTKLRRTPVRSTRIRARNSPAAAAGSRARRSSASRRAITPIRNASTSSQRRAGTPARAVTSQKTARKTSTKRKSVSGVSATAKRKALQRPVKGVPLSRLVLQSDIPEAEKPLPAIHSASSRNRFFDPRWKEKQDRAFTCWANYTLTPDEFKPAEKSDHLLLTSHDDTMTSSSSTATINKDAASLRAYQQGRRMNGLRVAGWRLFGSDRVAKVVRVVERIVDTGRLRVRPDRPMWHDVGNRQNVLQLLTSYNPLWLRLGLEVTFGETLRTGRDVTTAIKHFILRRVLNDYDIEREFAHPTVPHSYRDGFDHELSKHTLKKILVLVYFLDCAKSQRLVCHDPCLFVKGSSVTSSSEVLARLSRDFLSGEGDLVQHLAHLGYRVAHKQTFLDEFEYGIDTLANQLRDGIRLCRMVEILFKDWSLSSKLRVPPESRLQKIHNVGVALKYVSQRGVSVKCGGAGSREITAEHIVAANRESTLSLLWNLAAHFQIVKTINVEHLNDEIEFLQRNLKLKFRMEGVQPTYIQEVAMKPLPAVADASQLSIVLDLLLQWCRCVCAVHNIPAQNYCGCFGDGRVLACVISHYQPAILPFHHVMMQTRHSLVETAAADDDAAMNPPSQAESAKLLKNEKTNFTLVKKAMYNLGLPDLLNVGDFVDEIVDCKVVQLILSHLCCTLLDARDEIRAARTIQVAWRAYKSRQLAAVERARQLEARRKAAFVVTRAMKRLVRNRRIARREAACAVLRRFFRRAMTRRDRDRFLAMRTSAVRIQSRVRALLAVKRVASLRRQHAAARVIQNAWRRHRESQHSEKRHRSATAIQRWYRGAIARRRHLATRKAVAIQRWWRDLAAVKRDRDVLKRAIGAAVRIQTWYRAARESRRYAECRRSVTLIQARARGFLQRRRFEATTRAARLVQRRVRANIAGAKQRRAYLMMKEAAVVIQSRYRARRVRLDVRQRRATLQAAVTIQSWYRGVCCRRRYLGAVQAAVAVQRCWRGRRLTARVRACYLLIKTSTLAIQTHFRARKARQTLAGLREVKLRNAAATKVQAWYRGKATRRFYAIIRSAAVTIQRHWRRRQLGAKTRLAFTFYRRAATRIQAWYKGRAQRREYLQVRRAAVTIQRWRRNLLLARQVRAGFLIWRDKAVVIQRAFRAHSVRGEFVRFRTAVIVIQQAYRAHAARRQFAQLRTAVVVLQRAWRARSAMRASREAYLGVRNAVVVVQSSFRAWQARSRCKQLRERRVMIQAVVKIQAWYRCVSRRNQYLKIVRSTVVMQRYWRARTLTEATRSSYLQMKSSASMIQTHFRSYKARQALEVLRQERLEHLAAVKLQAWYRGVVARQSYHKVVASVKVIQIRWRAECVARQHCEAFLTWKQSAIAIQTRYRGYTARKSFTVLRSAVIVLQQARRAQIVGRRQRNDYVHMRRAVIVIQSHLRAYKARLLCEQLREEKVLLQAVVKIQSWYRCVSCRRDYRTTVHSTVIIQRYWRARTLTEATRSSYLQMKSSALTIQTHFRSYKARQALEVLRQERLQHLAAVKLQAWYRSVVARQSYVKLFRSVKVIQLRWRAECVARQHREAFLSWKQSAIAIQSRYRGYVAQKRFAALRSAVIVLQQARQAQIVGRKQRNDYVHMRRAVIVIQSHLRAYKARLLCKQLREEKLALQSAVKIQAWYRCISRRNQYLKIVRSTLVIQRYWRARTLMEATRSSYLQVKSSALMIQTHFRSYKARQALEVLRQERLENLAAVKLQAWYRGVVARQSYHKVVASVKEIQLRWRAECVARQHRNAFLTWKQSAIKIQTTHRRYMARKRFIVLRSAVIVLQQARRAQIVGRKQRNDYVHMRRAVIVIQSHLRAYKARLLCKQLREEKLALQSAVKIQAWYRCVSRRNQYLKIVRSTVVIQRYWRARTLMEATRSSYLQMKSSASMIQTHFRSYKARQALEVLRQERLKHLAAVKLQAWYRGVVARQSYHKVVASVMIIQVRWRAECVARQHRDAFLSWKQSAIKIQSRYRGYVAQKRFAALRSAAIVLQQARRAQIVGRRQRNDYVHIRRAAIVIQSHLRAYNARLLCEQLREEKVLLQAVVKIQSWYRCVSCRRDYRVTVHSTVIIQRYWRAKTLMEATRSSYLQMKSSALTIQTHFRSYKARQALEVLRQERLEHLAAVKLQAWYRGVVARQSYHKVVASVMIIQVRWRAECVARQHRDAFLTWKQSAIKIQTRYRGYVAQKRFAALRSAAIVLQQARRAQIMGRRQRNDYVHMRRAVIVIQSHLRAYNARLLCEQLREEKVLLQAAVKIQSWYRCVSCRNQYLKIVRSTVVMQRYWRARTLMKATRSSYLQMKSSALTIQTHFRSSKARQALEVLRQERLEHLAAVKLQAWYRGVVARQSYVKLFRSVKVIQLRWRAAWVARQHREAFLTWRRAAVKIQSRYRGFGARRRFSEMRNATVMLQRTRRAQIAGRRQRDNYQRIRNAAIAIQSHFRACKARSRCKRIRGERMALQAAVQIQSWYRCVLRRREYLDTLRAAVTIQQRWRARVESARCRVEFVRWRAAAVSLQSWHRMRSARRKFVRMRRAATHVQAWWKRVSEARLQRRHFTEMKSSAVRVQRAFRGWRQRRDYATVRRAAIALQRRWRALREAKLARADFLSAKRAAVAIQARWRGATQRRRFARLRDVTVALQRRHRANVACGRQRSRFVAMKRACGVIQAAWRAHRSRVCRAERSRRTLAAWRIQLWWRMWDGARTVERNRAEAERRKLMEGIRERAAVVIQRSYRQFLDKKEYVRRITRIQALYRGRMERRRMRDLCPEIGIHRHRLEQAHDRATLNPGETIHNKTTSALSVLLNRSKYTAILKTLSFLVTATTYLSICCDRIANEGCAPILLQLIAACGRDYGSTKIVQHSLSILYNLAKNQSTADVTMAAIGDGHHRTLVDVVVKFEDKSGRDRRTKPAFIAACQLLLTYVARIDNARELLSSDRTNETRLKVVQQETKKRYEKQVEQDRLQRLKRDRRSGYTPAMTSSSGHATLPSSRSSIPVSTSASCKTSTNLRTSAAARGERAMKTRRSSVQPPPAATPSTRAPRPKRRESLAAVFSAPAADDASNIGRTEELGMAAQSIGDLVDALQRARSHLDP